MTFSTDHMLEISSLVAKLKELGHVRAVMLKHLTSALMPKVDMRRAKIVASFVVDTKFRDMLILK
jgi:hypothetical protein